MRNFFLAAGVAMLAISVPAAAKPDNGKGRGAKASKVERGKGERVQARGKADAKVRVATVQQRSKARAKARDKADDRRDDRREARTERRDDRRDDRREARTERRDDRRVMIVDRRDDDRNRLRVDRDDDRRWARVYGERGWRAFSDCPPGLVEVASGCMPRGQYKKAQAARLPDRFKSNVLPLRLRNIYRDDDRFTYRYGGGNLYRVDRDKQLISAILPLIGAGLGIGTPFPYMGARYNVPNYYRPFYQDRNDDYFRYANGYVYEIDRDTGLIENMTPLLDRGYGIGQMLPASYGAYNVPYQYRSMYYDTPNAMYRYAPGAIYQVDPTTQLITAVASLLAPGLSVGQQLPPAYSMYNVPLGYRDQYYDRPDAWYRYNNGNIYQVDPTTQLVTALVRAIV